MKKYGSDDEDNNENQSRKPIYSYDNKSRFSPKKSDSDEEKKDTSNSFNTKHRFGDSSPKKTSTFDGDDDDDDDDKKPTSSRALAKYGHTNTKLGAPEKENDRDKRFTTKPADSLARYAIHENDDNKLKKISYEKDSLSNRSIEAEKKLQPIDRFDLTYGSKPSSSSTLNSKPKSILKKDSNSDIAEENDEKLSEFDKFKRNLNLNSLNSSPITRTPSPLTSSKVLKNNGTNDLLNKKKPLELENSKKQDSFETLKNRTELQMHNDSTALRSNASSVFLNNNKSTSLDRLNTQSAYNNQRIGGLVDTNKFDIKK